MAADTRILLTGAAGALGRVLRPALLERHGKLRCSDKLDLGRPKPGEELVPADLADMAQVERAVAGCSAIVHFGAISTESDWDSVLQANVVGTYHVFEAARRHGARRIVFASSNHAVGFHEVEKLLDAASAPRPDSLYGVSKVFGEGLGSLYVDKYGLEVACLRIGSCVPEPREVRHLSTWLSHPDLIRLVEACLEAPVLGFTVLYGVSANARSRWDNSRSPHVSYSPQDDAERYAARILSHGDPRGPDDPARRFHGGPFCAIGYAPHPSPAGDP